MTLTGVGVLQGQSITTWQETSAQYVRDFFANNPDLGVSDVTATFLLKGQTASGNRRLNSRGLQQQSVTIMFDELVAFRRSSSSVTAQTVVEEPFLRTSRRLDYVRALVGTNDPAFSFLSVTSPVTQPPAEDSGGISTLFIVIIAVAGGIALAVLAAILYFVCNRQQRSGSFVNVGDKPPTSVGQGTKEEVSTLHEPASKLGSMSADDGLSGYGDQT